MTVPIDADLVRRLAAVLEARLADRRRSDETAGRPPMTLDDRREFARAAINEILEEHATERVSSGELSLPPAREEELAQAIHDTVFGLGPLQRLLEDDSITDINVNGHDTVWVLRADGTKERVAPIAGSDAELIELIRIVAARMGISERRFDEGSPQLNLRLPDGSRLHALMSVSLRPSLSIRRHRFAKVFLDDLVGLGAIDLGLKEFLGAAVRARKSIIVAGGTKAGKTTLLRALINEIPPEERLVIIEKTYELGVDLELHPDVVPLEAREENIEGVGAVTVADLVASGLRMDPDRVIVGEVMSPGHEVIPMLNAMSQGNDGSMCTIHANSSDYVFLRLASYALQSPERLPVEATALLVAGAIDFVVFIGQTRTPTPHGVDVRRHVSSVREVVGVEGRMVVSNEVFAPGADRRAVPADPIRRLPDLVLHGYDPSLLDQPEGWWQ